MASSRPVDPSLRGLRERIDRVNRDILRLVQQRGDLVLEVAALKDALGLDSYDPRREAEMVRELSSHQGGQPEGPFSSHELETIFKALFAVSLELQRRSRSHAGPAEPGAEQTQPHLKVVGK
jgi:3-deoxy-7-phosphoheptulonate synthase/chorismate mutase